eukprot:s235_g12.t1
MAPLCVELKMLSGATVCLEMQETSSVHHLKSEFFQLRGIPSDCLELCQEGRLLSDSELLQSLCADTGGHVSLNAIVCVDALAKGLGGCQSISKTIRNLDLLRQFGSKDGDVKQILLQHARHKNEDICRAARRALFLSFADEAETAEVLEESMAQGGPLLLDALDLISPSGDVTSVARLLMPSEASEGPVRRAAVRAMGRLMQDPKHVALGAQILRAAVLDSDANVREEAVKVLRCRDPDALAAQLGQCLRSDDTQLVLWALQVATGNELRELPDFREILEGPLRSPWSSVELRLAQLAALLRLGDVDVAAMEGAAAEMLGAVRREGGEMKEALLQILSQLGQTRTLSKEILEDIAGAEYLEDASRAVRFLALDVLCSQCSGPGGITSYAELISHRVAVCFADPSPLVQQKFLEQIQRLDSRVVLAVITSTKDASEERALATLKALQKLIAPTTEEEIFQEVIPFAAHRCCSVRAAALELLGNDGALRQRSQDIFNAALSDPSAAVRSSAWNALCLAGGEGMDVDRLWSLPNGEPLEEWLLRARPRWTVRDVAAALEKLKGIEVTTLQQLRDVLKAGRMNDLLERKHFRRFNRATLRAFEEQLFN